MRLFNEILRLQGKARRAGFDVLGVAMSTADTAELAREMNCPGTLVAVNGLKIINDERLKQAALVVG